jgi:hypothetical protein
MNKNQSRQRKKAHSHVQGAIYNGIKTGLNEAWIDGDGTIYTKGSKRPADAVKHGVFVIDSPLRERLIATDKKCAEIISPLAIGDDVRRWRIHETDKYLIVTKIGIDMSRYPAIMQHLKIFEIPLKVRADKGPNYWELRPCDYYSEFTKRKIVFPEICKEPRFSFDTQGIYVNNKAFFIPLNDLYLLGVLNSSPAWEYAKSICTVLGDEESGGRVMLQWVNFRRLPIPDAGKSDRQAISELVSQCLSKKGQNVVEEEAEINARVTALYGL